MKKFFLSLSLFLFFVAGLAADASAKDLSRRFGLGVDSTISKYATDGRGISAIYSINKYFGMQLIFGLNITNATLKEEKIINTQFTNGHKTTIIDWNVSIRGLIPVVMSTDVNLTAVVGFTASGRSTDGFKASTAQESWQKYNDGYQFSIDLGVRPELFLSEHFSVHTQLGIGINIITESGSTMNAFLDNQNGNGQVAHATKASGVSVDFFKNVDLLGMAGCTFWF